MQENNADNNNNIEVTHPQATHNYTYRKKH